MLNKMMSTRDLILSTMTNAGLPLIWYTAAPRSLVPVLPVRARSPQPNAPLENLPPELRRHLLSILELEELSALVHASPVFHQQYLLDRRSLLCKCLETTLRGVTVDARGVYQTRVADFADERTSGKIVQFLKGYRDRRSSAIKKLTEEEAVGMAFFHSSLIKPLARHYTDWALANLADVIKNSQRHEPLSEMEETRLLRALYRFQLCCNLFGTGRHKTSQQPSSGFRSVDILRVFLCMFEPWEIEEIACVYAFIKEKYNEIFHDKGRDRLVKGTISRGLEPMLAVCFMIRDHIDRVTAVLEYISWPAGDFLEGDALGEMAQFQRRKERLSNRDRKQLRHDPLPFKGDDEPDDNGLRPPLAWTLIWRGTYSNLYGYCVPDVIRRWGYVMWDAVRLESTGAKEVLAQQWEENRDPEWHGSDPRDNML
ncbi:hypothetical protein V8E54_006899, partial [Elaphomyces granulatus]